MVLKENNDIDAFDKMDEINKSFKETKKQSKKMIKDPDETLKKLDEATKIFAKLKDGPLKELIEDIKLMISIVRSYVKKEYTEIPINSIIAILAAIIYVVNPFDIIPDFIPLIGYIDDAFVVALVLKQVHSDLEKYRLWKESNK